MSEELTVAELLDARSNLEHDIYRVQLELKSLSESLRQLNQTIFDRSPRNLSKSEIEAMLGFKVNIVAEDKMRVVK